MAQWYMPSEDRAAQIVAEIVNETRHWRRTAVAAGISRADVELTAAAFVETDALAQHSPVNWALWKADAGRPSDISRPNPLWLPMQ